MDINFRGKDVNSNKWISGYLVNVNGRFAIIKGALVWDEGETMEVCTDHWAFVKTGTISMVSPLFDMDCIPIYENDIIDCEGKKYVVSYLDGAFYGVRKNVEGVQIKTLLSELVHDCHVAVISNQQDNPELYFETLFGAKSPWYMAGTI